MFGRDGDLKNVFGREKMIGKVKLPIQTRDSMHHNQASAQEHPRSSLSSCKE